MTFVRSVRDIAVTVAPGLYVFHPPAPEATAVKPWGSTTSVSNPSGCLRSIELIISVGERRSIGNDFPMESDRRDVFARHHQTGAKPEIRLLYAKCLFQD
jgi:hypothetical protein